MEEETSTDLSTPRVSRPEPVNEVIIPPSGVSRPVMSPRAGNSIFSMVEMGFFKQHENNNATFPSSGGDESLAERLSKWLTRTAEADAKMENRAFGITGENSAFGIGNKPTATKETKLPAYAGCIALPGMGFEDLPPPPPPPPPGPPPPPPPRQNHQSRARKIKSLLDDEITEATASRDAEDVAICSVVKRSRNSLPSSLDTSQLSTPKSEAPDSSSNKRPQSTQSGRYRYEATSPKWAHWGTDNAIGYVRIMPIPKKPRTMEELEAPLSGSFEASTSFDSEGVEAEIPKDMASRMSEEPTNELESSEIEKESPKTRYQRAIEKSNAGRVSKDPPARSKQYKSRLPTVKTKGAGSMRIGMTGIVQGSSSQSEGDMGKNLDWDSMRNPQLSPRVADKNFNGKKSPKYRLVPRQPPVSQVEPGGANGTGSGLVSPLGRSPRSQLSSSVDGSSSRGDSAKRTQTAISRLLTPKQHQK